MLQDIYPHNYTVSYQEAAAAPQDILLCYDGEQLLVSREQELDFPRCCHPGAQLTQTQYLFAIDGEHYFLHTGTPLPQDGQFKYRPLSEFRDLEPMWRSFAAMTGAHVARWYRDHRHCGRCGGLTRHSHTERALICDSCQLTYYPQIAPALIIAVTDGDRLLLTRYADRPYRRFALIAGFAEVGETLEDCLRREVMEEVGLQVERFRYYKSQPWPFSNSLLMGFFCDVQGSREPHPDGTELSEAQWFRRQDLPLDDRLPISLTQEMIALFKDGQEPR